MERDEGRRRRKMKGARWREKEEEEVSELNWFWSTGCFK